MKPQMGAGRVAVLQEASPAQALTHCRQLQARLRTSPFSTGRPSPLVSSSPSAGHRFLISSCTRFSFHDVSSSMSRSSCPSRPFTRARRTSCVDFFHGRAQSEALVLSVLSESLLLTHNCSRRRSQIGSVPSSVRLIPRVFTSRANVSMSSCIGRSWLVTPLALIRFGLSWPHLRFTLTLRSSSARPIASALCDSSSARCAFSCSPRSASITALTSSSMVAVSTTGCRCASLPSCSRRISSFTHASFPACVSSPRALRVLRTVYGSSLLILNLECSVPRLS
jgi:hypothetical protein